MLVRNLLFVFCLLLLCGCVGQATQEGATPDAGADWQSKLETQLPELGHRNWILVVDKAYPAQTAPGVAIVNTEGALPDVVSYTLNRIREAKHIAPLVYQDSELQYLNDSLVAGVAAFRASIKEQLAGLPRISIPHDSLLGLTSADASKYRILVLKTESLIPYSSVFIRLDCGYWNSAQENRLRAYMSSPAAMVPRDRVPGPERNPQ